MALTLVRPALLIAEPIEAGMMVRTGRAPEGFADQHQSIGLLFDHDLDQIHDLHKVEKQYCFLH